jgi:hypothetical protein
VHRIILFFLAPLARSGSALPGRSGIGPSVGVACFLAFARSLILGGLFAYLPTARGQTPSPDQPSAEPPPEPGPANPSANPSASPSGPPPEGVGPSQPAEAPPPPPPPPPPAPAIAAPAPPGSEFMDTRLAFTCGDEDMLRDPTVLPSAPGFHCGRPNALGILFFDNYDTRFSGFETLSHVALYKHWTAGHWDIEGGFVILVNEFAEDNIRLTDGGSYIRAAYWFDQTRRDPQQLALVAFPVSADRMRLGYSYRISWGGSRELFKPNPDIPGSTGKNPNAVPGAKLQYENGRGYAYVGVKSTLLLDPVINEQRGVLAFLGGAGVDVTPNLRLEANGGFFDRGKNEAADVLGEPVYLWGASAQATLHSGMPVGSSIDYALYRNEPESIARLFAPETYPGGLSWLVSSEVTFLFQTLKDPAVAGGTKVQNGMAADLNLRVKLDTWRFRLDLMTRDLAYILHSIPSLPTYWDFPSDYQATNEYFAAVGVDAYLRGAGVLVGLTVGADRPATLTTPTAAQIPGNLTDATTLVVRDETNRSVLPAGTGVATVWALKGTLRKDFGPSFSALVDLFYQYDPNTVRYDRTMSSGSFTSAQFASFDQLGFDLTLQARF